MQQINSDAGIAALRHMQTLLEEAAKSGDKIAACGAQRIGYYLEQAPYCADCTLDRSFGLVSGRGVAPWYIKEDLIKRDNYLKQLRLTAFSDVGITEAAKQIYAMLRRAHPGSSYLNKLSPEVRKIVSEILRLRSNIPKPRHIQSIIGNQI